MSGHHVEALEGEIGHVADFLIEDETWVIRYLVVDTQNWWPGKKVLISPQWITRMSWSERKVFVNLSRETIKQSPEYTDESLITRDYEIGLHQHYDRQGYWIDEHDAVISHYPTLPFHPKDLEWDCFICQPASFIRASAYRRCGLDPDVNFSFDYDLWIRMAKQGIRFQMIPQYLAGSRMHQGAKTMNERETVFQASMGLLQRHYGYVPFSWVFGYTAFRHDSRDKFFQPVKYSLRNYLASLPEGLRLNPTKRARFVGDWLAAPLKAIGRKLE